MSGREWVLPLVLGGLAAGGVLLWPALGIEFGPAPEPLEADACRLLPRGQAWPPECRTLPDGTAVQPLLHVGWPFPDPPVAWTGPDGAVRTSTQLAVAEDVRPLAPCHRDDATDATNATNATGATDRACNGFHWATDHVGTVEALHQPDPETCGFDWPCRGGHPYLSFEVDETGPFLGADGHNATRVTVYVFDGDGQLVASNDGATQRNRFRLHGDFVTVSDKPWYLGDGPAPDGMRVPEGYVDFARSRLAGLPVGAVATAHVPTHEYDWLTGPLWVTVRVDEVIAAP